ncbi:Kinesin heavy chain like [Actinidia chinensis var. chinensis]|uniref:Kinesin heavy chain like n=1 Tax=Actinidia chinensis var. chinensis TaxID=1590841 RepID=A0A2R6QI41_ACTCC|nr:Kinesin heavy chain like [Actinidia chinensis var. chinensis]
MASSSQNNFDLNDVPNVQPEIRCSSFLSQKDPLMSNASVMLDDAVAASVARGIITPQDEKLLADRTDVEAINDSMALSIQCASSVSNMARRLQVRGSEVQELRTQVLSLQRRNRSLQQENKELKKLVDSYASDMRKRCSELEMNTNLIREQHESLLQKSLQISSPEA